MEQASEQSEDVCDFACCAFRDARPVKGSRPFAKQEIAAADRRKEQIAGGKTLAIVIVSLLLAAPSRNTECRS